MTTYNDRELETRFDEFLDECYPEVKIAGYTYSTSHALKEIDPIAYREGFNNWLDSEISEGIIFELPNGDYSDTDPEEEKDE